MASRKDNHKVKDMLEKMGMYNKRYIEDPDSQDESVSAQDDAGLYNATDEPVSATESEDSYAARSQVYSQPEPDLNYGVSSKVIEKSFWDDDDSTSVEDDDDQTSQYLDIDQLYQSFRMRSGGLDTIYLIEEYIHTLPDSLPVEMRRSIVLKIVNSSGFDFDRLLNDGIDRVARLNEYSGKFALRTEELVSKYSAEIAALEQQIDRIKELISDRKNLHKRQFLTIENEAQRLKEVLDFITK